MAMLRGWRVGLAAVLVAMCVATTAGTTHAATRQYAGVTITSTGGATVANASVACAPSFTYLIVGLAMSYAAGVTIEVTPPGGVAQVVATTTGPSIYVPAFLASCPAAGSVIGVVDNSTGATAGTGTISSYTPFLAIP